LQAAAQRLAGWHDFAAFAANRGQSETDTRRTIRSVKVRRNGPLVTIELEGDGFLYKMARMMVAAAVQCGQGKTKVSELSARLAAGRCARGSLVAPAAGLFLIRVRY